MSRYMVQRLLLSVLAIWGAASVVFLLVRLTGDPARLMLPMEASAQEVEQLRQSLGLNDPLQVQYLRFLSDLLRGDLGKSLHYNQPSLPLILERFPATMELAVGSILLATIIAVPAGAISAVKRDSWLDAVVRTFVLLGQAIPVFWLGIVLILSLAVWLSIFPTSGRSDLRSLVLPTISLAAYPAASIARMMRSAMLDVLSEDYMRTARGKGLLGRTIMFRHALKNAFIPVLTLIGLEFGTLLGGAVVTETVFAWPGVGRLTIQAIYNRDFPLVQASVIVVAVVFTVINLLVDMAYSKIDPRVQYD